MFTQLSFSATALDDLLVEPPVDGEGVMVLDVARPEVNGIVPREEAEEMVKGLVHRPRPEGRPVAELMHRGGHAHHVQEKRVHVADDDHGNPERLAKKDDHRRGESGINHQEASRLHPAVQVAPLRELPKLFLVDGNPVPVDRRLRHLVLPPSFYQTGARGAGESSRPCHGPLPARTGRAGRKRCWHCSAARVYNAR